MRAVRASVYAVAMGTLCACSDTKATDYAACRMETIRVLSQSLDYYRKVVAIDFMSYCMQTKGYKLVLKDEGGSCPYGIANLKSAGADATCFQASSGWRKLWPESLRA